MLEKAAGTKAQREHDGTEDRESEPGAEKTRFDDGQLKRRLFTQLQYESETNPNTLAPDDYSQSAAEAKHLPAGHRHRPLPH